MTVPTAITASGLQRLQLDAWTAPDLSATAPAPDSTASHARVADAGTETTPGDWPDPLSAGAEWAPPRVRPRCLSTAGLDIAGFEAAMVWSRMADDLAERP
jgi:hypothetical protein